ncbi:hypothetical protein FACS1894204_10380 [Synergistales bacterium]|nr:hypothetical protein FACS1894204_10380 [Synergistales bacterium]
MKKALLIALGLLVGFGMLAAPNVMYGDGGGDNDTGGDAGGADGHTTRLEIFYRETLPESVQKIIKSLEDRYEDFRHYGTINAEEIEYLSDWDLGIDAVLFPDSCDLLFIFYNEHYQKIAMKLGPLSLEEIVNVFKDRGSPLTEKVGE